MNQPGRNCPIQYRYSPETIARSPAFAAETLYVVGGLYGNLPALETILSMVAQETGPVTVVFNGDFHWFDVDPESFRSVNELVLNHVALRGNVETEVAIQSNGVGCGCAYPDWVDEGTVEHSNRIMLLLQETARAFPGIRAQLARLPMTRVGEVGGHRIGVVHGDAESLAGWRFSRLGLADLVESGIIRSWFDKAGVRIFASSHTCEPLLQRVSLSDGIGVIVNNGAAGMPNFRSRLHGLLTRISTRPSQVIEPMYGVRIDEVYVDALAVHYSRAAWHRAFLANWPAGSPANQSYLQRITQGPSFEPSQAFPRTLA